MCPTSVAARTGHDVEGGPHVEGDEAANESRLAMRRSPSTRAPDGKAHVEEVAVGRECLLARQREESGGREAICLSLL